MYIYIHIYIYVCTYKYIRMYLNRQIFTRLQSTAGYNRNVFCSVIRDIYIVHICRYIHIYIFIYIHVCIFIYAYIHAYIHIYTSIHTYVPGCIWTDSTAHGCDQRQAIIEPPPLSLDLFV